MDKTYQLVKHITSGQDGIKCLDCGMTSYHPDDIKNIYCGNCHKFHSMKQFKQFNRLSTE